MQAWRTAVWPVTLVAANVLVACGGELSFPAGGDGGTGTDASGIEASGSDASGGDATGEIGGDALEVRGHGGSRFASDLAHQVMDEARVAPPTEHSED